MSETNGTWRRRCERLQARLDVMERKLDEQAAVIRQHLYDVVDANMKIKQALAILHGNDA